jgi:hypothetical protein
MDWSYIAGFFDGEGNLHLNFVKNKSNLQLICRIYSSEREILDEIIKFTNYGKIYQKKGGVFELAILKKSEVANFLKNIYPYLYLKKNVVGFILETYNFNRGSNEHFDIQKFRSFVKRKGVEKFHKNNELNRIPNK